MMRIVRKRFSVRKSLRVLIPLILIIIILINTKNIIYFYESQVTGYKFETIKILNNKDIYDAVKDKKYSKTLEKIIYTDSFNIDNVAVYLDIVYLEKFDFFDNYNNINKLILKGYNAKDINMIYNTLSDENILLVLDKAYLKNMADILNLNYFIENNMSRYLEYCLDNELTYTDLVTYVNIGLDKEYYTSVTEHKDDVDDITILVNKYNSLPSDYVPSDLEAISSKYNKGSNNKMRKVAKEAFEKMCEAALADNIKIYSGSAYRSYNYQLNLYNRYVNQNGKKEADRFSARAGYSEHQTGLATDIMKANWEYLGKDDREYKWLVENSYKYGFILRYPEGKENVTGYMTEEWHFRYVGLEVSLELFDMQITYDEYVARQLKNS